MSVSPSTIRTHRMLGFAAILHAAIIAGIDLGMGLHGWFPCGRLWVAFVTLWFIWPVTLLVHRGRSLWRVATPLLISLPFLWLGWREYPLCAGEAVGLPPGVSIYPSDLYDYFTSYRAGRAQGNKDVQAGVLAVEEYGMPKPQEYEKLLRERYQVELRHIAGDTDVTVAVIGGAEGYNELSKAEIGRRFGPYALEQLEDEAWKLYREDAERSEQRAKDLAKTLSSIPPGSKVTLESVVLNVWNNQGRVETDLPPTEMANVTRVIRWLETLITSTVPADAPAFDSEIWADPYIKRATRAANHVICISTA